LEAINIGNLEDDISLETSISITYSGSDNSQGWNASGTSIEGIQVNQTGNPSVSWSVPNDAWNGTIMQIRVEANARGDVVDTIIFNVEVPHIKEWRAISSQVDLEINPEGSSIDIEILQLGNSPSNAYSTVYVNGSNDWIVETPEELPILLPGESAFMTLNITPPENAQHGKTVELHIRLREGNSLSETIVPLRVAVIHQFDLDGQGPWVVSEHGGFPHATLLNEGNAPTMITINVRSLPSGWEVIGETTTVLAVGELKGLPIELIPDSNWEGETYTIKIEAIDELGNVDEILLDTVKQDYSWGISPIITMISGDNTILKIHGTNSESSVIDGSQGLLNWDNDGGWLWLASQSVQDGEITIDSDEGLVYSSYISEKVSRSGNCHLSGIQGDITAYCSINNGTGIFDYTFLLIDDKGKLLDSYSGTLEENYSLEQLNLTAINWDPEPGKRNLILRALDSRGVEFISTEKVFDIRRNDWNIGLSGIELVGVGSNQQVQITTIRENQNLLSNADCLLEVSSDGYSKEHVMEPSAVYFLPKIDRPDLPDGSELVVRFSCAFPWDIESDSTDNEQRIILTDGSDNNDGIENLETGIAAAALVIGLSVALAWLVKNHRERKEMIEITEKAIKQNLSNKKNAKKDMLEEIKDKVEDVVEIVENVIEDTVGLAAKEEEIEPEEELDEFELRLRRLGKL